MLTDRYDVAIIGGGIVGCSAALELSDRGLAVVLLEKSLCGQGASGVNFGGVRQQGRHASELPLSLYGNRLWPRLAQRLGIDVEYVKTGHIKLARCEQDVAYLESYAEMASGHGLHLKMMSGNEMRSRFPWLGTGILAASHSPEDGQANPRLVAPAMMRRARSQGVTFRENTTVSHMQKDADGFSIATSAGGIRTTFVINAAGPGGAEIARQFAENTPAGLMIPNMLVTEPLRHFIEPAIGVCGGDFYLRQIDRGNVIFGGGDGYVDTATGFARPDFGAAMDIVRKAVSIVPELARAAVIRTWSGIEAIMPDHLPVLGPSARAPGLFHAFGFSGHGFQLGPVIGEILADLITKGRSDFSLDAFRVDRFSPQDP